MHLLLAYRPILDPLNLHQWWFVLLVPLAFLMSIAYKAVRVADWTTYWRQVLVMTGQTILGMVLLGAAGYLFVAWVLPAMAP